ncbi:SMP-30/gluconolactonase/LRE family protein [Stappia sp. F7233]|uniref:SMP-30/gluconolactonase/LRE family protein n=1 Tax=Stappia albiluteola TaxID=2758565 RepID=A0A839ABX8_9HYPH|nr:SMP-30/gluconolactonase/LRE family protein [Stappia albiluteola]MBA5776189.1 SMP-30/gluconolactonase/LRE family protein [Stappia albiluteola]
MPGAHYQIHDERFAGLIHGNANIDVLWSGGRWTEGPAYFAAGRYLVWSDIPNDRLLRWDETSGHVSTFEQPCRNQNGHTVDREGRLISCEHRGRCVSRYEIDGSYTVLADSYDGKRLNSPNDVVVKSDGSIWFTDPSYGIDSDYEGDAAPMEQDGRHVYRIDPSGKISRVIDDMKQPNGLAFSADESVLYVADTGKTHFPDCTPVIRKYPVKPDGASLGPGADFVSCDAGLFDGFRLDTNGNIWSSAGDGVHCFSPDGTLLGKILIDEVVANICFGGPKRNRLFICATTTLRSIYVNARGLT